MINRICDLPSLQVQGTNALRTDTGTDGQFAAILQEKMTPVRFSAHASARLSQRNIELNDDDLRKLAGAVDQAASKGGRDTLVSMNDISFVVNVPNRTVVTALDRSDSRVFTQIDSAVFVS
jgi:flagellar operon protein